MGAYTFNFPTDFQREFTKEYTNNGNVFQIDVAYLGVAPRQFVGSRAACHMWAYQIFVKGNKIHEGPYYWGVDKRDLNLENVANHLASYWGHDKTIEEAQELEGSPEYELNLIVDKCAAFMHGYFISETYEHTDYDIVNKHIDEDMWVVLLRPNYMPNRLMEFYKTTEMEEVQVNSYIEDNERSVKF